MEVLTAAPTGFAVAAHGADHFATGLQAVISGRYKDTATSQILQKTGLSEGTANTIDNTMSVLGTIGGAGAARTAQRAAIPQYSLPPTSSPSIPGVSNNRAVFEQYKTTLRTQMEMPYVYDPKLKESINQIYRPNAKIGNGSTAAAVRHELMTGSMVGNKYHSIKGRESITFFENWLKNNPTARAGDRAAVENIIKDTRNAFGE